MKTMLRPTSDVKIKREMKLLKQARQRSVHCKRPMIIRHSRGERDKCDLTGFFKEPLLMDLRITFWGTFFKLPPVINIIICNNINNNTHNNNNYTLF